MDENFHNLERNHIEAQKGTYLQEEVRAIG